jgi:hypothetical protein
MLKRNECDVSRRYLTPFPRVRSPTHIGSVLVKPELVMCLCKQNLSEASMRSRYHVCWAIAVSIAVTGCASRPSPLDASKAQEIGETHIAVVAAAPLNEYIKTLRVGYELSPADALSMAIPVSQVSLMRYAKSQTLSAAIARSTVATPTTPTLPSSDEVTPPATSLDGAFPADEKLSIDPVLRYQAATRLLAEVKMMDRTLRDTPYDPTKEQAHLLQLNISVMPFHDAAPYDVFAKIIAKTMGARLIPVLVNDSYELTQQQLAKSNARAFNLATTTGFSAIAGALGFNYANNKLEEMAGYGMAGIVSVGGSQQNAVTVRIGAQSSGSGAQRYLAARSYNVFVLAITPKRAAEASLQCPAPTTKQDNATTKQDNPSTKQDNPSTKQDEAMRSLTLSVERGFRKVNNGSLLAAANPPNTLNNSDDIHVMLPDEEVANFGPRDECNPTPLIARATSKKAPDELQVTFPGWNVSYLGDIRAIVSCGDKYSQLAAIESAKFGKGVVVTYLDFGKGCDNQRVSIEIERLTPGGSSKSLAKAKVVKFEETTPAAPSETKKEEKAQTPNCGSADNFVVAGNMIVNSEGKAKLQALLKLSEAEKNSYRGKKVFHKEFLRVIGADVVGTTPTDGVALTQGRLAFSADGRYSLHIENAVPGKPITIEFARAKGKEFVDVRECLVLPVALGEKSPATTQVNVSQTNN